jgi:hypothetical protein
MSSNNLQLASERQKKPTRRAIQMYLDAGAYESAKLIAEQKLWSMATLCKQAVTEYIERNKRAKG